MQSEAKKGSVTGYSLSPLSRREGRKRNKSFPLQGGRQSDTSVTTWAQLITCPSLQGKTCVSFPSLPNAEAREAAIRHRSLFWDYIPKCLCKIRPLPQPYPRHPHLSEGPLLSCCLGFDKYQYHWGQDSQTHLICTEKGYRPSLSYISCSDNTFGPSVAEFSNSHYQLPPEGCFSVRLDLDLRLDL